MAFTDTKLGETVMGNYRMTWGTFSSSDGDTGGDINTGLHKCELLIPVATGGSIVADSPTVSETIAAGGVDGTAVTIITTANTAGLWIAFGW
ncbi:MAG: hypothetical protein LLG06_19765 [Desulfobacteraceae bacterium]|nr:hypothetical protein [Desulfobacteraceae bacterium]